jgi:hypothetical protein
MRIMPTVRRQVARRPWLQWVVIGAVALGVAASVADVMAEVGAARRAWGTATTVWVTTEHVRAGEPIRVEAIDIPAAIRPPDAAPDPHGAIARHAVGRGEIVSTADIVGADGSLAPRGWLVAPIRESLPSGAVVGERVGVASDGFLIAGEGVVVGFVDDVTLVAVPAEVAPLLPAASAAATTALLRSP